MKISKINTLPISFKSKDCMGDIYSECYYYYEDYNGPTPDNFILARSEKHRKQLKPPRQMTVFDLGAGQGRNTFPLAQRGDKVYAWELSEIGLKQMQTEGQRRGLTPRFQLFNQDILTPLKTKKTADFAFMAHVSQLFSLEELQQALQNIAKNLNHGGEFILDALVRQNRNYKKYDEANRFGAASFWREDIVNAGRKAGLDFVLKAPFKEGENGRPLFERSTLWGGLSREWLLPGDIEIKPPVKLLWFCFNKK